MAATSTARAFSLSPWITDFSPKPPPFPPPVTRNTVLSSRRYLSVNCLSSSSSSSNGGGVSDDFVSTRKLNYDRGFSVIANMLKRIEPLDNSVISNGVSNSAKDSMKQTISTMLGLLPSDQFSVLIRVSKLPLDRLIFSAIITGYTLWNAEYRISLMRNLNISREENCWKDLNEMNDEKELKDLSDDNVCEVSNDKDFLQISPQLFGNLPPEALNYIQKLESELSDAEQELDARRKETVEIECNKGSRNDLLDYLRSLDSEMVSELSRPSSIEVEDIIQQLVQNILRRFFKDDPASSLMGDIAVPRTEHQRDRTDAFCDSMGTSRDYLAKLLFWCMLLGHHLRALENRLHLSCVVGLL